MPICKKCGAEIKFVLQESGRYKPMNVDPSEVVNTKTGEVILQILTHWATCPNADTFRKKNNLNCYAKSF